MYPFKAMWYESEHYDQRADVPRTEEYETFEYSAPFYYDEIEVSKAKHGVSGVDFTKVKKVITTKKRLEFAIDDVIEFEDGSTLKVNDIRYRVPDEFKNAVKFWGNRARKLHEIKVLYLE